MSTPAAQPGAMPTTANATAASPEQDAALTQTGANPESPTTERELGDAGKKALDAERSARKAAEDRAKTTEKAQADLLASIAKALGQEPEKGADPTATLQKQLDELMRENAVEKLARKHRITDEDDIASLKAILDPDTRERIAARLAPKDEEPSGKSRPKPDRSVGSTSGSDVSSGQRGRAEAERRFGKQT